MPVTDFLDQARLALKVGSPVPWACVLGCIKLAEHQRPPLPAP